MLSIESVCVRFGDHAAVDNMSFDVGDREIVVLLGPSGCGKSTLLRSIAGLQPLDSGRITNDGIDLVDTPPHRRGIGMMFQDHALFPHRDVGRNIEFGLRMQGIGTDDRAARVSEMLGVVGLPGFERRAIANLSGGEAQRVALARALAPAPRLLLLDEPLGSLDRELRDRLVEELPQLLRRVGIAAVHVTHDHDEAFAIGDRLVVMGAGRVLRVGNPTEVWADPRTETVARFLGHRNMVTVGERGSVPWGVVDADPGRVVVLPDAALVVDEQATTSDSSVSFDVDVVASRFRGGRRETEVVTVDGAQRLVLMLGRRVVVGTRVALTLDPRRISRIE